MEYKTTDIVLSSAIITLGAKLNRIEVTGNRGTFVFDNIDEQMLMKFDMGQLLVEPVAMNNAIKRLTTSVRRMQKV